THVYAYDAKGNSGSAAAPNTVIESTPPTITDVSITNITIDGFKVSCKATDNVGVSKVVVSVWTSANGTDDIKNITATKSGDTFTAAVNVKDHNYESGTYCTKIVAYDALNNQATVTAPNTNVPEDPTSTIVVTNKITLTAINGDQWADTGAYYWNTGTFKAVWWRVLAAVPDGRNYKVTAIYEANTGSKTVDPPSNGFLIAVHAADPSYNAALKVNVGDHFTLYGVNGTSLASGAYAGFGEFKSDVEARELTPVSSSKIKVGSDNVLSNVTDKLTASAFLSNFESNTSVKKIFDRSGNEITAGSTAYVGTGCTVKLLDSTGKEIKSYTVKVTGDVDGDGQITSTDYTAVKASFKSSSLTLTGIFAKAADTTGNGRHTVTDYIAIRRFVTGNYTFVK
ncbi:MAG: GBS Bsp-like repeat-containing protein, partial [Clostridia bacterium]|nr:GBS Bsp-like repeat-containing protein [Clostridia bacterium]